MVKKAIIPAAGYGTRNLPVTKVIPKEMFPIGDKPAIQLIIEEAMEAGLEEILIILSRQKNVIMDYFDRSIELETYLKKASKTHLISSIETPKINIQYVRQPYANGLGDAILLGKQFIGNDSFAVLLPDDVILTERQSGIAQLLASDCNGNVIGLNEVDENLLKKYGVVEIHKRLNNLYKISDIIEKPQHNPPSNLAVIGRYVFQPSIISYLEQVEPDTSGEVQLTDAIKNMLADEHYFGKIIKGNRFDIGNTDGYLALNKYLYETEYDDK